MDKISIQDFVKGPLREFAQVDNERSIPHLIDGLKESQRKILYTMIKYPDKIKVSRFSSKVAEYTSYIYGENSLIGAIVNMAQDFPGTNNEPLLQKDGQFGSRLSEKSSAPRYIYVSLHDNYKRFFDDKDLKVLEYKEEDGDILEPKFFVPKIPMILVNGANGIGNGFRCNILNYRVSDISNAILESINQGKITTKLQPYLKDWNGTITKVDKQVIFKGTLNIVNSTTIEITELPPNYDLIAYKEVLIKLIEQDFIKSFDSNSTEEKWHFIINCPRSTTSLSIEELINKFELVYKTTETLTLWTSQDRLKIYNTIEEIIIDWIPVRLEYYERSRFYQIEECEERIDWLEIKRDFILYWNKNSSNLVCLNKKELIEKIFNDLIIHPDYINKLLELKIYNLTLDDLKKLESEIIEMNKIIDKYKKLTSKKMMLNDIKILLNRI